MINQNTKNRNKKSSGSALIITLLVVTVLIAIGFSTSRLTISEITQSTQLEDSEIAYQAAEAGVEMGLLLYRYDRDAQVPSDIIEGVTADTTEYLRYDITEGQEISSDDTMQTTNSYFDLLMYHKNNGNIETVSLRSCDKRLYDAGLCVQVDACPVSIEKEISCYENEDGNLFVVPALMQDQAVEYNTDGVSSMTLSYKYLDNETQATSEQKVLVIIIPESDSESPQNIIVQSGDLIDTANASKIRIKPFGASLDSYILETTDNINLDSRYTIIESTGYFNNTKRKLKVELDRATGSILSPYDFTIYSSNPLTQ